VYKIALLHIIARPPKFLTRGDFEFISMAMGGNKISWTESHHEYKCRYRKIYYQNKIFGRSIQNATFWLK
jgi:hypothetical protein